MQNISTLPLCQGRRNHGATNLEVISVTKAKEALVGSGNSLNKQENCATMSSIHSCEIEMPKNVIMPKEAMQMLSNWEALKEAFKVFTERKTAKALLLSHISEVPKFYEVKSEPVEVEESVKATFSKISARAREAFIEEQIGWAIFYNIPYKNYGNNYNQLMEDIDRYEYLLKKAKDYCVDWDTCEYDPLALEQAIEEAEHNAYLQDRELRSYFSSTRGVEA